MAISFVLLVTHQKLFLTKTLKLELDSAASSGGEDRLTYFMYFTWPRLSHDYQFQGFVPYLDRWEAIVSYLRVAPYSMIYTHKKKLHSIKN
jgi:hypothetical protein